MMSELNWKSRYGGRRWTVDPDGFIVLEDGSRPRSAGEPKSARTLRTDYAAVIKEIDERIHREYPDAPDLLPYLATLILLEAGRLGDSFHRDPTSLRKEPDYISDHRTPDQISAGLVQTLLSTARAVNRRHRRPLPSPISRYTLFVPYRSLLLGGLYLAEQAERYEWDPIILSAAYNAGGVYEDRSNDWHLRVYRGERLDKTVEWWNDWRYITDETCNHQGSND